MGKEFDFTVSGYSGVNYFIEVDSLPEVGVTQIVRNGDNGRAYLGGNGINIVYYLHALGLSTLPVIRLGEDDNARSYREFFKEQGISTEAVSTVPGEATSICYMVESARHEHMVLFYPGAMNGSHAPGSYCDEVLTRSSYFLMSVASARDNRALLETAKRTGTPLIFSMKYDPDGFPDDLLKDALEYAGVIFMNDAEEEQICRILSLDGADGLFRSPRVEVVVVTLGEKGSRVYERAKDGVRCTEVAATRPRAVVDTAGAGDSFAAGFLSAMLRGENPVSCARYGSTVASFVIEHQGCMPDMPSEQSIRARHASRKEENG